MPRPSFRRPRTRKTLPTRRSIRRRPKSSRPTRLWAQAQAKLDAAQATANASAENYRQGAIAFFKSVGADDAADIILNCKLAGYNKVGEEVDATSLTNMKQAVVWLKACNEYRASVGLGELKVTYAMMATAIADANFSDTKVAHAQQFNVGENVAWNYGSNPFKQWVDQEKAIFDAATASLGASGLTGKAAYDFYTAHSSEIDTYAAKHGDSVGHYINVIDPSYTVTGMGRLHAWDAVRSEHAGADIRIFWSMVRAVQRQSDDGC